MSNNKRKESFDDDRYSGKKSRITRSLSDEIPPYDDEERHYKVRLREGLGPSARFKVLSFMGEGTFGKVVECWDREKKQYVAVKIIRAIEKYREAAMIEIDILKELAKHDPDSEHSCVKLLEWFDYRDHICMVFPKFGLSLYDFLKRNKYQPFCPKHVKQIGLQLLNAIAFLHRIKLTHTDLKPENILFVDSTYSCKKAPESSHYEEVRVPESVDIKLIDFGSATWEHQHHSSIVATRHYRAPEVILGMGWSYPCDIWSVGCILAELYLGEALFQTHENIEHLALMEKVIGEFPRHVAEQSRKYFRHGKLQWPKLASSKSSLRHVENAESLKDMIPDEEFLHIILRMLEYDPETRIRASDAVSVMEKWQV